MARQIEASEVLGEILNDLDGDLSVYGQSQLSTLNSFAWSVAGDGTQTGTFEDCSGYNSVVVTHISTTPETFWVYVQWSDDGINIKDVSSIGGYFLTQTTEFPVLGLYYRVDVTDSSHSANQGSVKTILRRFPPAFTPVRFSDDLTPMDHYANGPLMMWGRLNAATNFFRARFTSDVSPIPSMVGDDSVLDGTSATPLIAKVRVGNADNALGTDPGLVVNARLHLSDGTNWDKALTSGLPVTPTGTVTVNDTIANALKGASPEDYYALGYTGSNLTTVTLKSGGAGGATLATWTLAYTGSRLDSVTKT